MNLALLANGIRHYERYDSLTAYVIISKLLLNACHWQPEWWAPKRSRVPFTKCAFWRRCFRLLQVSTYLTT